MGAQRYEIVVRGSLGRRLCGALAPFEVTAQGDGVTRLVGWVPDQSALQATLQAIGDLGLELRALRAL